MRDKLRLLLIQIRNADDPMRDHELRCFSRAAGLPTGQLKAVDAVTSEFRFQRLSDFDALLIGGSGEYSVAHSRAPFIEELKDFLGEVVDRGFPTFASCFGFHVIAEVLGGEVVTDLETMEVGTFELELTDAGQADPLFSDLGDRFLVQMGHKDRLARLPEGVSVLARGERIDCQALRVTGKPVWASQFHPELDRDTNRERYLHYFSIYPGAAPDPKILASFRESSAADQLLPRFIERVVEDKG